MEFTWTESRKKTVGVGGKARRKTEKANGMWKKGNSIFYRCARKRKKSVWDQERKGTIRINLSMATGKGYKGILDINNKEKQDWKNEQQKERKKNEEI